MAQKDVVDLPRLGLVLGIGISLTIVSVAGGQAIYLAGEETQFETKELPHSPHEITDLRSKQRDSLETYRVVDKEHKVVSIPIDVAMELKLKEMARTK